MKTHQSLHHERGMALILCTLFTVLTLVLLATLSTRLVGQAKHVAIAEESVRVLAAAEDALARVASEIQSGGSGPVELRLEDGIRASAYSVEHPEENSVTVLATSEGQLAKRIIEANFRRQGDTLVQLTWRELSSP